MKQDQMKSDKTMTVCRYNAGLAEAKLKGKGRSRIYSLKWGNTIQGFRIYAEKHCVSIKIPLNHPLAFGLPEGKWLGNEGLVLVSAQNINPALFGRE